MLKLTNKKYIVIYTVLLIFSVIYLLQFFDRGLSDDENYNINIVKRILDGDKPYIDFYLHQPPGAYYFHALIFRLFGSELIISRLLALFISLAILILLFFISSGIMPHPFNLIPAICFLFWGMGHLNYFTPTLLALAICLWQLFLFLKYMDTKRRSYLFVCGVLTWIAFLMKQNLGIALLTYSLVALCYNAFSPGKMHKLSTRLKYFIVDSGFFVTGLIMGIVISMLGALAGKTEFIQEVRKAVILQYQYAEHTGINFRSLSYLLFPLFPPEFKKNLLYGAIAFILLFIFYFVLKGIIRFINNLGKKPKTALLAFIVIAALVVFSIKNSRDPIFNFLMVKTEFFFIYIPYLLLILTFYYLFVNQGKASESMPVKNKIAVIATFTLSSNYFSFLYSSNFIRQILAYPSSYILLGFCIDKFANAKNINPSNRKFRIFYVNLLLVIFLLVGHYTAFMQYAQKIFMVPISTFNTPFKIRHVRGIKWSAPERDRITSIVKYVKANTDKGEYVFVFPYDLLFYFLTETKSPTYYEWFMANSVPLSAQPEIINDINKKQVKYVILRDYNSDRFNDRRLYTVIDKFLNDEFSVESAFDNFTILRKKGYIPSPITIDRGEASLSRFTCQKLLPDDATAIKRDREKARISEWDMHGLGVSIDKEIIGRNKYALLLLPTSFKQHINRAIDLSAKPENNKVTFGVWTRGIKLPGFIRLRISTSKGNFEKKYNISSKWIFYMVTGDIDTNERIVSVYVFPDNGTNGESFSDIAIARPLLVYKDISFLEDKL